MRILSISSTSTLRDYKKTPLVNNLSWNNINSQDNRAYVDSITFTSLNADLLTREEVTTRLLKFGLGSLPVNKFASVLEYFRTTEGYSKSLMESFDVIFDKLEKNKIPKKGIMTSLLTELVPNVEKFNSALNDMLERDIAPRHIATIFEVSKDEDSWANEIDYKKVRKLLRCRDLGVENIATLEHPNRKLRSSDIDDLFFELPKMTLNTFDLLGEKAFVYSFKNKMDSVINYLVALGQDFKNDIIKEKLMLLTNPILTSEYQNLAIEINALKQEYKECCFSDLRPYIEKQISTLSRKKNDILENSIRDPKNILEVALIVSSLKKQKKDAIDVLEVANPKTSEQELNYRRVLNDKVHLLLGVDTLSDNVAEKVNFTDCKYLSKIFASSGEFRRQFKKVVKLLEQYPDETTFEVFNRLPQNKKTKEIFDEYGIDYEKYALFNEDSKIELKDDVGEKNGLIIRKVDMNNIKKSLFLGQDADCCFKVGGTFDFATISNMKNKFMTAIEVFDDNRSVGNTMCYFALVNNELAFVLDNIALKRKYQYNDKIAQGIFEYAKKMCAEVGKPEIPIYLSGIRNEINVDKTPRSLPIKIIGSCAKDYVYIDFIGNTINIDDVNNKLYSQLVRIN